MRSIAVLLTIPALALVAAGCGSSYSGSSSSSSSSTAAPSSTASSSPAGSGYGGGGYGRPKPASSAPAAGQTVKLAADPGGALRFTKAALSAQAGTVTLELDNPSSAGVQHGIAIEGNGVDRSGPVVAAGSTSTVTATLKAGTYTFYCPFDGHKAAGMKGTLTVR
jgi:uncharacterized cupredoxin-like copper-binding protein